MYGAELALEWDAEGEVIRIRRERNERARG